MEQIITHFTFNDVYKFNMCYAVMKCYPRAIVKYRFYDRNNTVYPKGFAEELKKQVKMLENLRITDEEIDAMKKKMPYVEEWFFETCLRGFKYDSSWVEISQDEEGHLNMEFNGHWWQTILLEVQVMQIICSLYYIMRGEDKYIDYDKVYEETYQKGVRLLKEGCKFVDFGLRRALSPKTEDVVVKALMDADRDMAGKCTGKFLGTSNVWLAIKYNLPIAGTQAHEWYCGIAGILGSPLEANYVGMKKWAEVFKGDLGLILYDSYGFDAWANNLSVELARGMAGVRQDSGEPHQQLEMLEKKFNELGVDFKTKTLCFSNALTVDEAIELQHFAETRCKPTFGIGGHFTNTFEFFPKEMKPLNVVIKLIEIKITEKRPFMNKTCKFSCDSGKTTGDKDIVEKFKSDLHID